MLQFYDGESVDCPRCGRQTCEVSAQELFCPICNFQEILSDTSVLEEDHQFIQTLGQYIEYVPADYQNWDLNLNEERNLKMNATHNQEPEKTNVTFFDVMVKEDAKNGATYWQKVGVAFPLSTGTNGLSLKLNMFPNLRMYVMESIRSSGNSKSLTSNSHHSEEAPF